MTIALILTINMLTLSRNNQPYLDVCLGSYEQKFLQVHKNKICSLGSQFEKIICQISVLVHTLMTSNILEAYLLYHCFQAIKHQTEKSAHMIGEKSYRTRKVDNGIVISISVIQWGIEVLHAIFTTNYFIFLHGISNYADKFFALYLISFNIIIQTAFYLNGDASFRRKLARQEFLPAFKAVLFPMKGQ